MYSFKVQGNSGIYEVIIDKQGDKLIATCTCANAEKGMICSHRRSIINGYDTNVIENKQQVKEIKNFVANTKRMLVSDKIKEKTVFASIKAEKVKNDKIFFFERTDDNSPWTRMGKSYFDFEVKANKDYAFEIKYDDTNSVVFMRYVKNGERMWSEYKINSENKNSEREPKRSINSLKVTIGKNEKRFYYEQYGEDGNWLRIEKSFFEFLVENYNSSALERKLDENGNTIYLRYVHNSQLLLDNDKEKKGKGCLPIILTLIVFVLLIKTFAIIF